MRWFVAMVVTFAVVVEALAAQGATVTLESGRSLKGRVIVRNDVLTLLVHLKGKQRLYQFPMSDVVKIEADDPDSPNIVSHRTALRAGDSRRSEPLFELERGLEVKRLAIRRGWVQVEAWNEEAQGFILGSELASEIRLSPEERATIKARLGVVDPPPPPHSTKSIHRRPAPTPKGEQEGEEGSVVDQGVEPDQQSDASVTQ